MCLAPFGALLSGSLMAAARRLVPSSLAVAEAPCDVAIKEVEAEVVFQAAQEEYHPSRAARRRKRLQRTAILRSMAHSKTLLHQLVGWGVIGAEPGPVLFGRC